MVNRTILPANSDRHVGIIRINKKYSAHYVSTFMLTKYGRYHSIRHSTGNVQLNLFIYKIKNIKIPFISTKFQETIEGLIKKSSGISENAHKLYTQAEDMLLNELGFADYAPTNESVSVKTFSNSLSLSRRLDAEYYQPKYDELFNAIRNFKCDDLGNIVTIKKSIEPGSYCYGDEGVPFVRVSNLSKHGISEPDIKIPSNIVQNILELYPKKDTILLSKDGSIGIAYKVEDDMEFITSGATLHLNVKNRNVLPDYLTLVLNSIVGQLQAERDSGGSIIQHWRVSEIENVIIPVLDINIQQKITSEVKQSFILKKQAERLLEIARTGVEKAIEECEASALAWIDSELKKFG